MRSPVLALHLFFGRAAPATVIQKRLSSKDQPEAGLPVMLSEAAAAESKHLGPTGIPATGPDWQPTAASW